MMSEVKIHVTRLEMWILRTGMAATVAVLGWIGVQFKEALVHVAEIRKELEIVKPADILAAVHDLDKRSLTRDQVRIVVQESAPWGKVEGEWNGWRLAIEKQVYTLAEYQRVQAESAKTAAADRFTRTQMRGWASRLKDQNQEIKVPEVP